MNVKKAPKIFISYSWSNPSHEEWVMELAQRLCANGVDTSIDKWDLKGGHDKYHFMEQMVNDSEIDKVLIILDKIYTEKANQRKGGAGTESQIITQEIYSNVSQEKFIPIAKEADENGIPYVPTYLKNRIYINFTQDSFENSYEKLLRNIFGKPEHKKPKLGKPPSYLFEEIPSIYKVSSIVKSFDNQIAKDSNSINQLLREFTDSFLENLKEYSIKTDSTNEASIGKEICDTIRSFIPLRNEFVKFFIKATTKDNLDIDIVIRFMEKLGSLRFEGNQANQDLNCRIVHELFLYLIGMGLKNENYNFIKELLYSSYLIPFPREKKTVKYSIAFRPGIPDTIKKYCEHTLKKNYFYSIKDLIIDTASEDLEQSFLIEADRLCHYIALWQELQSWVPFIYFSSPKNRIYIGLDLFDRLYSKRHFEKIKTLFEVNTIEEFKAKLNKIESKDCQFKGITFEYGYCMRSIHSVIDVDKIGTER